MMLLLLGDLGTIKGLRRYNAGEMGSNRLAQLFLKYIYLKFPHSQKKTRVQPFFTPSFGAPNEKMAYKWGGAPTHRLTVAWKCIKNYYYAF